MINVIVLAAGKGSRFGANKLLHPIEGKPMFLYALELYQRLAWDMPNQVRTVVVTAYEEILLQAEAMGFYGVKNHRQELGISHSIGLGIMACKERGAGRWDSYLFSVCDLPWLDLATVKGLIAGYLESQKTMGCVGCEGELYNPAIFSACHVPALLGLTKDVGGKQLIRENPAQVYVYPVTESVIVTDIDVR